MALEHLQKAIDECTTVVPRRERITVYYSTSVGGITRRGANVDMFAFSVEVDRDLAQQYRADLEVLAQLLARSSTDYRLAGLNAAGLQVALEELVDLHLTLQDTARLMAMGKALEVWETIRSDMTVAFRSHADEVRIVPKQWRPLMARRLLRTRPSTTRLSQLVQALRRSRRQQQQ